VIGETPPRRMAAQSSAVWSGCGRPGNRIGEQPLHSSSHHIEVGAAECYQHGDHEEDPPELSHSTFPLVQRNVPAPTCAA
jgi:hypothetical protein